MYLKRLTLVAVGFLLAVPVWANPIPLGSVSRSQGATVRGTNLAPGATVFSGDTIEVGAKGSVWIALRGGGQVHVFENSSARLTKTADSIQLTIDRGNAQTSGKVVVINNADPKGGQPFRSTTADQGVDKDCDKDKDCDCEASKHKKRHHRHCEDDRD